MAVAAKHVPTVNGSAKCLAHFEGSDTVLDLNYNFSSLTDNGVGDFSPQIGNDMASVHHVIGINGSRNLLGNNASGLSYQNTTDAVGSFDMKVASNGAQTDLDETTIVLWGDLA